MLFGCGCGQVAETLPLAEPTGFGAPDLSFVADFGLAPVDLGPKDLGAPDLGPPDLGVLDTGPSDTGAPPVDLLVRLEALPGVTAREISADPGTRAFTLYFEQPENHDDPNGPTLSQRLVLTHVSDTAPMVIHYSGYALRGGTLGRWANYPSEPAQALNGANVLAVEHRFFGSSRTSEPRWEYLTVGQSALDSHRIVEALKTIYTGTWMATGVSKGGMTAIFHHHRFPNDLDAIAPYVAPISLDLPDRRYIPWMDQIGPTDCRNRVLEMAREIVTQRVQLAQLTSGRTNPPEALVLGIAQRGFGYHWSFWQYYDYPTGCAHLPTGNLTPRVLEPFVAPSAYSSEFDWDLDPYQYQAQRELGGPAIDYSHLGAAAFAVSFPPPNYPWPSPSYDPAPMQAVDTYLRTRAEHVLAIYGDWDPWTGGQITLAEGDNRLERIAGAGHAARLSLMTEEAALRSVRDLRRWMGVSSVAPVDVPSLKARIRAAEVGYEDLLSWERALPPPVVR